MLALCAGTFSHDQSHESHMIICLTKLCCCGAEGAQKQHLVEIWAQLEAARGDAEEQKRQLATAQVSALTEEMQDQLPERCSIHRSLPTFTRNQSLPRYWQCTALYPV